MNQYSLQTILARNLLSQDDRQKLIVRNVLDFGRHRTTSLQEQCRIRPRRIQLRQLIGNAIVLIQQQRMQRTHRSMFITTRTRLNIHPTVLIRPQRLELPLRRTIQPGTIDKPGRSIHLVPFAELARSRLMRRHRSLVLLALVASSHIALVQLLAAAARRIPTAAALDQRRRRRNLHQIVRQQLAPRRQHCRNVRMTDARINGRLQRSHNGVGRRQRMRSDRRSRLAASVRIADGQQPLEDVAASAPAAIEHVVAFAGRRSEFARRAWRRFGVRFARHGVGSLEAQGFVDARLEVAGRGRRVKAQSASGQVQTVG